MSKSTKEAVDSVVDPAKSLVIKFIVKQAMAKLLARLPFLAWGPLGWFAGELLSRLLFFLADKTILGAVLIYIDVSNDRKVKAHEDAEEKVKQAIKEGKSAEEIAKLDKELADKGRALIKFGHINH